MLYTINLHHLNFLYIHISYNLLNPEPCSEVFTS